MRTAAAISRAAWAVLFERAAFGHVEDDLEFALVVERQHLDLHPADAHQRHRAEQQRHDGAEKNLTPAPLRDHRPHDAAINPGEEILLVLETWMWPLPPVRSAVRSGANIFCPSAGCGSKPTA